MIGFGYILFFGLYFYLTVWLVRLARRSVNNKKLATSLTTTIWVLSLGAIFWDVVPVYVVHNRLCARDAGFVLYKTLEQWKLENPGVAETLVPVNASTISIGNTSRYEINQRFAMDITRSTRWYMIDQIIYQITDMESGATLAQHIDFYTNLGNPFAGGSRTGLNDFKTWISISSCEGASERKEQMRFNSFEQSIDSIGGI